MLEGRKARAPGWTRSPAAPWAAYGAFLAWLLWTSWLRWPDAWGDFGHFLFHAWRVSEGAVPGRDFTYFYGPLALLSWGRIFRWLGPSIYIIYVGNLLLLLADVWLIHKIFRPLSRGVAAATVLAFLGVFALSQYIDQGNYNLLAPYKPEAALGTTLLLALAWLGARGPARGRIPPEAPGGALLCLLLLTASEYFLAGACVAAAWALSTPLFRWWRFALSFLLGTGAAWAALGAAGLPSAYVFRALSLFFRPSLLRDPSLRALLGSDRLGENLAAMALAAAILGGLGLAAAFLGERFRGRRRSLLLASGAGAGALLLAPWLAPPEASALFLRAFAMPLPLLAALGLALWWRDRGGRRWLGIWSALSLSLLARMLFRPLIPYYGFTLAMPATLLLLPLFSRYLPRALGWTAARRRGLEAVALALLLLLVSGALRVRREAFLGKSFPLAWGSEVFYDWDPRVGQRGAALRALLAELAPLLKPGDSVLALPNGQIVNYLLKAPRPGRYAFVPGDLHEAGETVIEAAFECARPRFVAVMQVDPGEDVRGFGAEFGQGVFTWLARDYVPRGSFGDPAKIWLWERR